MFSFAPRSCREPPPIRCAVARQRQVAHTDVLFIPLTHFGSVVVKPCFVRFIPGVRPQGIAERPRRNHSWCSAARQEVREWAAHADPFIGEHWHRCTVPCPSVLTRMKPVPAHAWQPRRRRVVVDARGNDDATAMMRSTVGQKRLSRRQVASVRSAWSSFAQCSMSALPSCSRCQSVSGQPSSPFRFTTSFLAVCSSTMVLLPPL